MIKLSHLLLEQLLNEISTNTPLYHRSLRKMNVGDAIEIPKDLTTNKHYLANKMGELALEQERKEIAPDAPSRLNCVYSSLIPRSRFVEHVRIARELGQKIVVDIDDHMEGLEETNLAYKTTHPDSNPDNNRDHYIAIIEQADALITSTPFLKDFYQKKYPDKPIFLIRNGIDIERWGVKRKDYAGLLPKFGWVGATPWRSGDLETLNPFFGEFLKQKHLKFHHAGNIINAPTAAQQIGIDKKLCTVEPMKTMLHVPELYRKMDVGIAGRAHGLGGD